MIAIKYFSFVKLYDFCVTAWMHALMKVNSYLSADAAEHTAKEVPNKCATWLRLSCHTTQPSK